MTIADPHARYQRWFRESDALVRQVELLRMEPHATRAVLDKLRAKERALLQLKEEYLAAEGAAQRDVQAEVAAEFASPLAAPADAAAATATCDAAADAPAAGFQLSAVQRFLRDFFAPASDRTGLLLYHGVGVGKTCTAISIAEQFVDAMGRRALVVCPRSVIDQFAAQVLDVKALVFDADGRVDVDASASKQCTGARYVAPVAQDLQSAAAQQPDVLARRARESVAARYELVSFNRLLKLVDRMADDAAQREPDSAAAAELLADAFIRHYFSDRVIIVDEVHNLRDEDEGGGKRTSDAMLRIVRCAENVRLLLLTATPVFNSAPEVLWLVNLLLANDRRPELAEAELFDRADQLTAAGAKRLTQAAAGYVSFAQGGADVEPQLFPRLRFPKTPRSLEFHGLHLTASRLIGFQAATVAGVQNQHDAEFPINVAFPGGGEQQAFGRIDDAFVARVSAGRRQYEYRADVEARHGRFLQPASLPKYGAKLATVIELLSRSRGPAFVYSFHLKFGLEPLAIALEHAGYTRLGSTPPLLAAHQSGATQHRGTYAILCGDVEIRDDMAATLRAFNAPDNADGSRLRVILGSNVLSEGVDLKRVRQVHVLEPWWHMNKIEQILGRATRRCSHQLLPEAERVVDAYLHVAVRAGATTSHDLYRYETSQRKGAAMERVVKVLRDASVDACVFGRKRCRPPPAEAAPRSGRAEDADVAELRPRLEAEVERALAHAPFVALDRLLELPEVAALFQPDAPASLRRRLVEACVQRNDGAVATYLPRTRTLIPRVPRSLSHLQLRERFGSWRRPACGSPEVVFEQESSAASAEAAASQPDKVAAAAAPKTAATLPEVLESLRVHQLSVMDDVRACIVSPAMRERAVRRLATVVVDYVADRLAHDELLMLLDRYIGRNAVEARNLDRGMLRSFVDAAYLLAPGAPSDHAIVYGYDFFEDRYYRRGDDGALVALNPYEFATQVVPLLKGRQDAAPAASGDVVGFMTRLLDRFQFKISRIGDSGGWTRGTICDDSLHNKEELARMVADVDAGFGALDTVGVKRNRLCVLLELTLRAAGRFRRCSGRAA